MTGIRRGALRLLFLLTLFLGGAMGHEFAMAGGMNLHRPVIDTAHVMHHETAADTCAQGACDADLSPCCIMGQCLVGIVTPGAPALGLQVRLDFCPRPVPILMGSPVDVPFRPPVAA